MQTRHLAAGLCLLALIVHLGSHSASAASS